MTTKPQKKTRLRPFIVGVANDLSEYASVRIYARDSSDAEDSINEMLDRGQLSMLEFEHGDDREGPYTCDVRDDDKDTSVDLTVRHGQVIQPRFKLKCPHCGYDGKEETKHGGTFRYLTDITSYRDILRFTQTTKDKPASLSVEGRYETYDEDEEKNDRLECRSCLEEFSFPKSLEVEFI